MLALCFTSNKHLLQLYQMVTNLRFEVPARSILCIPQKSPLTLLECVICVFEIGVGLVLVFVGFGLFHICLCFSFSPYSKDHALQQVGSFTCWGCRMGGRGSLVGQDSWGRLGTLVNNCKQCQKQWSDGALTVGLVGGAGNFIFTRE